MCKALNLFKSFRLIGFFKNKILAIDLRGPSNSHIHVRKEKIIKRTKSFVFTYTNALESNKLLAATMNN